MALSDRERFLSLLFTGPLLTADAIVVLAGEDATPRAAVAAQLLRSGGAARIFVTGGRHEPPRHVGATKLAAQLMGMGIAPDRITTDDTTAHTWAQATGVAARANDAAWRRVLLVASSYHLPRAYLTFVKALTDADLTETVHVVPVPTSASPWFGTPTGAEETRAAMLSVEAAKVDEYGAKGHCATYAAGLAYMQHWEMR